MQDTIAFDIRKAKQALTSKERIDNLIALQQLRIYRRRCDWDRIQTEIDHEMFANRWQSASS